jgi:DNA-binding beta-propeller fold protein YncE
MSNAVKIKRTPRARSGGVGRLSAFVLVLFALCWAGGCDLDRPEVGGVPDFNYELVLVNSLARTIQVVGRETPRRVSEVALTGASPNQLLFADGLVYCVNSLSNDLQVFDPATWEEVARFSLGVGTNPYRIAAGGGRRLLVSCLLSNEVLCLDRHEGRVLWRAALPGPEELPRDALGVRTAARPQGLWARDGQVWVALANLTIDSFVAGGPGLLAVIEETSGELSELLVLEGRNASGVFPDPLDPDVLYVPCAGDFRGGFVGNGQVDVVSIRRRQVVGRVSTGGAPFVLTSDVSGRAFLSNGADSTVLVFDTFTRQVLPPVPVPPPPVGDLSYASAVRLSADGRLFVLEFNSDRLFVFDADSYALAEPPLEVGEGPVDMLTLDGG